MNTEPSKTQKIIARIQQLRAISKSTHSRAEAETTLTIAAKLIAEYQLSEAELQVDQRENDPIDLETESIIYESGRLNQWKHELAIGLAKLNGLFLYNAVVRGGTNHRKSNRYRIIGRKSDVLLSLYMMEYLTGTITELSFLYVPGFGKRGVNPDRESWSLGCVRGFIAKMQAEKDEVLKAATSTALVFIGNKSKEAKDAFLNKTGITLKASSYQSQARQNEANYNSGYKKGQTLSVSPGLSGSSKSPPNRLG